MFQVKRSDCRTGWMIVDGSGRPAPREMIYKRHDAAFDRCADLNAPERGNHFKACTRCGQTVITRADVPMCTTCKRLERAPQGVTVRLFEPAPTQLDGQMSF